MAKSCFQLTWTHLAVTKAPSPFLQNLKGNRPRCGGRDIHVTMMSFLIAGIHHEQLWRYDADGACLTRQRGTTIPPNLLATRSKLAKSPPSSGLVPVCLAHACMKMCCGSQLVVHILDRMKGASFPSAEIETKRPSAWAEA
jgi:hypothetical protein